LTKEIKDLYTENHKILMKKVEEDTKMECSSHDIGKMYILPKAIYGSMLGLSKFQ
jgi:hypothetical protein